MKSHGIFRSAFLLCACLLLVAGCAKQSPQDGSEMGGERPEDTWEERSEPERPMERPRDGRIDIENLSLDQLNRMGLLENVYFDFDKYNLKPDAIRVLRANAEFLREYPSVRVQVEGHCDERGTNEYNMSLGDRRANAARSYLVRVGIASSRLSTISYGEERPYDPGHNERAWAKNRRAHFKIVAK